MIILAAVLYLSICGVAIHQLSHNKQTLWVIPALPLLLTVFCVLFCIVASMFGLEAARLAYQDHIKKAEA